MLKMRRLAQHINRALEKNEPPMARDIDLLRQYANEYRNLMSEPDGIG